ncbi:hypothetical protein BOTBODRAFT_84963, partial [Botryobasidium botryosum FD-172 SS1]
RCFPHVINIAVTTAIEQMKAMPLSPESSAQNSQYAKILTGDLIKKVRQLVTACRASGQWREDLRNTISDGNDRGIWELRVVELLKDVDTRWSSLFLMIDQVLELYSAIGSFLSQPKHSAAIGNHTLYPAELRALNDIREFLSIPHTVQELLSAEKTPTLALAMPLYERLISMLKDLHNTLPLLSPAITASISKLEEYVLLSCKSRVYGLA